MRAVAKQVGNDPDAGASARPEGRTAPRLAWSLWAVVMALGAASLVLRYLNGSEVTGSLAGAEYLAEILWWDVLVPAAIPAYATVGAFVASRRPGNAIAWMSLALAGLVASQEFGWEYAARAYEVGPGLPAALPVAWITHALNPALAVPFILILLLFPDGKPPSRRWRIVVWAAVAGAALSVLADVVAPTVGAGLDTDLPNPTGVGFLAPLAGLVDDAWSPALAVLLILSVASLFFRWRRSSGVDRLQIKWLALLGAIVGTAVILGVGSALASGFSYPTVLFLGTAIAGVTVGAPAALGVAVLRYRLYDVDIVVNRALVYAGLTACVVAVYVVVVGYLGNLFRVEENLAISLFATGVVAVLFAPLRDRLQRAANRFMYGERDEPYAVLSRLGERLEAAFAPQAVLPAIVETVAGALKAPHAEALLLRDGDFETAARHGTPSGEPLVLPLVYGNETLGRLVVSPRSGEEAYTPADRRLLEDLARQAGAALYAVRVTADLQRSRERLVAAREEERRRLRRDLHDGVGPRLAALTLKIETARNRLAHDPAAEGLLSDLAERSREAVADVRRSVHALRPPVLDELGLVPALRETAAQYGAHGPEITVQAPEELPPLPAAVEVAAYRIAQEAITNVVRHAGTENCAVRLGTEGSVLRLEVEDDGRGIVPEGGRGVGLSSMRERAEELGGACVVEAVATGGTRVRAELPVAEGSGDDG